MTDKFFLCGFMGSGKSTIAKQLAQFSGTEHIDLDDYIVERENNSIPEIFAQYGEEYFRQAEIDSLGELCESKFTVIALGGGTLMRQENISVCKKYGKIIFLDIDFDSCYKRIKDDKNRPLVTKNSENELRNIFNMRCDIYKKASDIIVCANSSPSDIATDILAKL